MKSYKTIFVDGKQMRLHRYIMEQHLGRKLSPDELVHHINEDKNDNRIENLAIVSRSQHKKEHKHIGEATKFKSILDVDKDAIFDLYITKRKPIREIAETYGVSSGCIQNKITAFGLLGKRVKNVVYCKTCGEVAKYTKTAQCNKCYQKEYGIRNGKRLR